MRMGQLRARARLDPGLHSAVIANAHGFKRGRGWPTAGAISGRHREKGAGRGMRAAIISTSTR